MKKVKVMLTAIAVLAIVGGSLAFKAKKSVTPRCVFTTDQQSGQCIFTGTGLILTATTTANNFKAYTATLTTTQSGGPVTCTNGAGGALGIGDLAPVQANCVIKTTVVE
jgi:hypothetical protein